MPLSPELIPKSTEQADVPQLPPEQIERLCELLRKNPKKPKAWSKASTAPYYRAEYGLQMKCVLDEIIKTSKPFIWRYNDPRWSNLKPDTLYKKINQSLIYVKDCLDPDYKYAAIIEACLIHKKKGVGIIMEVRQDILYQQQVDNPEAFMPNILVNDNSDWRDRLTDFLERGQPSIPFEVTGLALSEEEQEQIKIELCEVQNIVVIVSDSRIKVVKIQQ